MPLQTGILTTKLYRPRVAADLEPRSRLTGRLKHNCHRPLILPLAPAGYGKTMLASMWLQACGRSFSGSSRQFDRWVCTRI